MTTEERDVLENPNVGMQIYNITTNCLNYWNGINWVKTCGGCTPQPTHAYAGPDQSYTDTTTSTTLEANIPEYGTGLWFVESGEGGSFSDNSNPAATFTGQPCSNYTLLWTISTNCYQSTDTVNVVFISVQTQAIAGEDKLEVERTWTTPEANEPEFGVGVWTILQGEGERNISKRSNFIISGADQWTLYPWVENCNCSWCSKGCSECCFWVRVWWPNHWFSQWQYL